MRTRGKLPDIPDCISPELCYLNTPALHLAGLFNCMSQHSSLRGASALGAKRNVLKRFERVELLKKRGQWKTGDRVTGLRKTKPEV